MGRNPVFFGIKYYKPDYRAELAMKKCSKRSSIDLTKFFKLIPMSKFQIITIRHFDLSKAYQIRCFRRICSNTNNTQLRLLRGIYRQSELYKKL